MAHIVCQEDCGNAPKKLQIRDFNVAVAEGNAAAIEQHLSEDAIWHLYEPGNQQHLEGRKAVLTEHVDNRTIAPREVLIEHILTHGKAGSANGIITSQDENVYVFCDVYIFTSHAKSAKIKEITSYIIEKHET